MVKCGKCGIDLDEKYAAMPRIPCPACGSVARAFFVNINETLTISASLSTALAPGAQERNWLQRWEVIKCEAARLDAVISEPSDSKTIIEYRNRLHAFFVQCYHLKDALIAEAPNGITKNAVENAITNTPELALVADLCNLDKHVAVTSRPRSGEWPTFGTLSGTSSTGESGWRLSLEVLHKRRKLDGVTIARDAVAAWERVLGSLGAI